MTEIILIFALLSWVGSIGSIALSYYTLSKSEYFVKKILADAKEQTREDTRVQLEAMLNAHLESVHNDALQIVDNALKDRDQFSMASFRNLGE